MFKFFRAIDDFFIAIEDYFDYRVKTGKWLGDVKGLSEKSGEKQHEIAHRTARSRTVRLFILYRSKVWNRLLQIAAIEKASAIVVDGYQIIKRFFIEVVIILLLTLLSSIILFNLFINSPLMFFISFFPSIFINLFLLSALYCQIEERQKNKSATIFDGLRIAIRLLPNLSAICLIHIVTNLFLVADFFMFATFYSSGFTYLRFSWDNAFLYWIIIAPLFILLLTVLFYLAIITYQSYFILILEKKNIIYSFKKSLELVRKHNNWFFFFYLSFSLLSFHITYWLSLSFFPIGFILGLFFFGQGFFFLSYLLQRKFPYINTPTSSTISLENKILAIIFIGYGLGTYIATSALSINNHASILNFADRAQKELASQQLKTYTNTYYGYMIDYPGGWTIDEGEDKSITIYNNFTQTVAGGVLVRISALPFSEIDFNKFYNARAGLLSYDTLDKDVKIKVDNLAVQDKYPAVKYTYLKPGKTNNEYTINYLIHKDDLMYDITFLTKDKNVQGDNADLFQKMIDSFKFVE
jgi:hypothetical protein